MQSIAGFSGIQPTPEAQFKEWLRENAIQSRSEKNWSDAKSSQGAPNSASRGIFEVPKPKCYVKLLDEVATREHFFEEEQCSVLDRAVALSGSSKAQSCLEERLLEFKEKALRNQKELEKIQQLIEAISINDAATYKSLFAEVFGYELNGKKQILDEVINIFPLMVGVLSDFLNLENLGDMFFSEGEGEEEAVSRLHKMAGVLQEALIAGFVESEHACRKIQDLREIADFQSEKESVYSPNKQFLNMIDHLKLFSDTFNWGVNEESLKTFQKGLCYGLASHYLKAVHCDRGPGGEELANFVRRLSVLGQPVNKNVFFFGKDFSSLVDAYSHANDLYREYSKQCQSHKIKPDFHSQFRKLHPQAHFLMEIQAWFHSLLLDHKPLATEVFPYVIGQNIAQTALWSAPDLLSNWRSDSSRDYGTKHKIEDNSEVLFSSSDELKEESYRSETWGEDFKGSPLVSTSSCMLYLPRGEMRDILSKLPSGHYLMESTTHVFVVTLDGHFIQVFDQNCKGYLMHADMRSEGDYIEAVINHIYEQSIGALVEGMAVAWEPIVSFSGVELSDEEGENKNEEQSLVLQSLREQYNPVHRVSDNDRYWLSQLFNQACRVGDLRVVSDMLELAQYKDAVYDAICKMNGNALLNAVVNRNFDCANIIMGYVDKTKLESSMPFQSEAFDQVEENAVFAAQFSPNQSSAINFTQRCSPDARKSACEKIRSMALGDSNDIDPYLKDHIQRVIERLDPAEDKNEPEE